MARKIMSVPKSTRDKLRCTSPNGQRLPATYMETGTSPATANKMPPWRVANCHLLMGTEGHAVSSIAAPCLGCCCRRAHAARTTSHVGSMAISSAAVKLRAASRQKWLHPQQGENGSKSMQQRAPPTKPGVIGGAGGGWGGIGEKGGHGGVSGGNGARGGPLAPWQMK